MPTTNPIAPARPPSASTALLRHPTVPLHGVDAVFGALWPEPRPYERHARLVLLATVPAVLAAALLPGASFGLALTVVALMIAGLAVLAMRRRLTRSDKSILVLIMMLLITGVSTSAGWSVALSWVAASVLIMIVATGATGVNAMVGSVAAVSMAWLRGCPWLLRSLRGGRSVDRSVVWPVVRTVLVAGLLLLVFGALFSSADAMFAVWVDRLLPSVDLGSVPYRIQIFALVSIIALSVIFTAAVPIDVERLRGRDRPAVRRFEWAVPVASVLVILLVFVLAEARALFGGAAYVAATTGLSYADYVHQGFGQLIAATALVLVVVATAVRRAARVTSADRRWLRVLLGSLCLLALVVAASALRRLSLYDDAFGSSRLRLLVAVFEIWVVIVLVLVGTVCVRLRGEWVPKVAVLIGAVLIAAMSLAGPDRLVADRNVDRFEATGTVDWEYLATLSPEVVPEVERLPEPYRSCVLSRLDLGTPGPASWNAATSRARSLLATHPIGSTIGCDQVASR